VWDHKFYANGIQINLQGWAKDVKIVLSQDDIDRIGESIGAVFWWFKKHRTEIGLVEFWRETHYDKQFFDVSELEIIVNSDFVNDEDIAAVYARPQRQQYKKSNSRVLGGGI